MVPPVSDRAPPTPPYSGSGLGWPGCRVRGCHPLRPAFPGAFRYPGFFRVARPATPDAPRRARFGLAPFRSPLLGGSLLFSFPPATWMFRFAGLASALGGCRALARRVAPFGHPRIHGCSRLPADFRGLPRPSSPPGAQASPVRLLSLVASQPHRRSSRAGGPRPLPGLESCARRLHRPAGGKPLGDGAARLGASLRRACRSRGGALSLSRVVVSWRDARGLTAPARASSCLLSFHPVKEPPAHRAGTVENAGLEPATPGLQSRCSSRLSQSPLPPCSPGQTRTADPHIISVVL